MAEQKADGRNRVVVERVSPEIDCGRFAIKRVVGETVLVEADVFADGHDQVACQILYWHEGGPVQTTPMKPLGNDRWRGEFSLEKLGRYQYTVEGWIDRFQTWRGALVKQVAADQDVQVELLVGADLIDQAAAEAASEDAEVLRLWAKRLRDAKDKPQGAVFALEEELLGIIQRYPVRTLAGRYEKELTVTVDREKARFSTWYEMFPRSCSPRAGHHGTFRDCELWLPYIASMGFDVVYLPPIHPIGRAFRKERTIRRIPNRRMSAVRGPSGRWKAGTSPFTQNLVRRKTSSISCQRRKRMGSRSHSILRFSARQTIRMCVNIGIGSARDQTGRYSTPRTRRRNIRIFSHWTSRSGSGGHYGKN